MSRPDPRRNYQGYDQVFKQGFIALNNGDFETAVQKFEESIDQSGHRQPLVSLELATAWSNMEQYDRAQVLLEEFIEDDDTEIRAYQMLCDIYWVTENYEAAMAVIDQCPASIRETFAIHMLLGETYYQMGKYQEAETQFLACKNISGKNELVSRSLAKTYEAMGNLEIARDIYVQILDGCTKCGVRSDPFILRRYAELCFACGERTTRLLELYLSMLQDDPESRNDYCQRIYALYHAMGNKAEALRYQSLIN